MGIKVLSLCDGMSCGRIALEKAGIKVDQYFASEIKDIAIKVTQDNYPDTIQIGSVTDINYNNGILYTSNGNFKTNIDMVIFGSPCQSFSLAMKTDKRIGLQNKEKSGLFLECYRILKEVNPKYFLLENVNSMKEEDKNLLTSYMGVEPIMIDGAKVGPVYRKRLYWTNIPNITQPEEKSVNLQSILDCGYVDREKGRCLLVSDSRPLINPLRMFYRYYSTGFTTLIFKSQEHYKDCIDEYHRICNGKIKPTANEINDYTGHVFDGVRYMNQNELEKCHSIPSGYTKCLNRNQAADVIGDGWQVDVISHIFSFIKNIF